MLFWRMGVGLGGLLLMSWWRELLLVCLMRKIFRFDLFFFWDLCVLCIFGCYLWIYFTTGENQFFEGLQALG